MRISGGAKVGGAKAAGEIDLNFGGAAAASTRSPSRHTARPDDRARTAATPTAARDIRSRDPHLGLRFWLQLGQVEIAGFRECSPLIIETEVEEYKEGGLNTYYHKLPTRMKYTNITLKRGMDDTSALYDWYVKAAAGQIQRQNISIVIYDSEQNNKQQWDLKNAYPCKWTGPELKAESGHIAVESVEIAHEGLLPTSDRKLNIR